MFRAIGRVYRAILYGSNGTLSLGRLLVLFGVVAFWHVPPCLALPDRTDDRPGDRIIRCNTHTGFARVSSPSDFSNVRFRQLGPRGSFTSPDFVWSLARPVIVATWHKFWVTARKVLIPARTSGAVRMRTVTVAPKHSFGVKMRPVLVAGEVGTASSARHVFHILFVRPDPQMRGANAAGIVAVVPNVRHLRRGYPVFQNPSHSMRPTNHGTEFEVSVSGPIAVRCPDPAISNAGDMRRSRSEEVHFRPEAFFCTLSLSHRRASSCALRFRGLGAVSSRQRRSASLVYFTMEAS